jgi:hypothetical protein
MDRVQELYSIAIQRAGEENRLDETDDGQLIIRTNKKRQNGLAGVTY